jgi:glycine cleavage system H protein
MSSIPEELKYTSDHEWARKEGDAIVICGITDYAQEQLTDIVFVELPEMNRVAKQGEQIAVVESVKAISDVFSPVSGKVVEINSILEDSPELINSDPYGDGWIFKIEAKDMAELDKLMNAKAYAEHIESEE